MYHHEKSYGPGENAGLGQACRNCNAVTSSNNLSNKSSLTGTLLHKSSQM